MTSSIAAGGAAAPNRNREWLLVRVPDRAADLDLKKDSNRRGRRPAGSTVRGLVLVEASAARRRCCRTTAMDRRHQIDSNRRDADIKDS